MKKKIFASIMTAVLALAAVFAGCTAEPGGTQYTVTFNAGSGTVTPETVKVREGGKVSKPTATYKGHSVEGWYEESTYANEWIFSQNTVKSDITLHAKWKANSYEVTFDVNGGDALDKPSQSVTYGLSFNLPSPTRSGFNFNGWTYNNVLITNRNGKGNNVWAIDNNVTVVAKWTEEVVEGDEDVSGLVDAIANMGYNYTASVWDSNNTRKAYDKISTEEGIYKKAESEYMSNGYLFDGDLVFEFKVRRGNAIFEEEPYAKDDGTFYTKSEIFEREYLASVINPQAYLSQGKGIYACRAEYRNQQGSALLGKSGSAVRINITVSNGYISRIGIEKFLDSDLGKEDTIEIEFDKIGSSSIDDYTNEGGGSVSGEWPASKDDSKPVAPSSYAASDDVKPVDSVPSSAYTNGANDNALPELKAAIDAARQKIRYNFEDYYDDTYFKNTQYWSPSSQYYIAQYEGYKAYVARSYSDTYYPTTNINYVVLSGGKVYRIDDNNGDIKYVERDSSFDERTLGGNIFFKLNASMFEKSSSNSNVYTVKAQYLDAVCEVLFYCARNPDSYDFDYDKDRLPAIVNNSVTVTLTSDGKFQSILAERGFTFYDNKGDDIQQMKFSFDYKTQLVMPYEKNFSEDELVLKSAIANTGSNYTLDLQYYDQWHITEYYADEGIWKWYLDNPWGSSGFYYINDYAYFMDFDKQDNSIIVIDYEIYDWFDGPAETDGKYFRAWMNVNYLPFAQLDPRDFTRTGEKVFELKSSAVRKYDRLFFDFEEENGLSSMKIYLDDQGRIEKVECYNNYMGNEAAYASTVYVGDIGSTKLPSFSGYKIKEKEE